MGAFAVPSSVLYRRYSMLKIESYPMSSALIVSLRLTVGLVFSHNSDAVILLLSPF